MKSLSDSVFNSIGTSVNFSVRGSVSHPVWDSVSIFVWYSVWNYVRDTVDRSDVYASSLYVHNLVKNFTRENFK